MSARKVYYNMRYSYLNTFFHWHIPLPWGMYSTCSLAYTFSMYNTDISVYSSTWYQKGRYRMWRKPWDWALSSYPTLPLILHVSLARFPHASASPSLICKQPFFKILFYSSIVDLQGCVNFCCTAKWCSYAYIYTVAPGRKTAQLWKSQQRWDFLFHILFHYGLSQVTEYSSLCYTVGPCRLSTLYIIVCIC